MKSANESLKQQKIQMETLEKKIETLGGLVEQNNFSKVLFENIQSNKKLLLDSLSKEYPIVQLVDGKYIIGKNILQNLDSNNFTVIINYIYYNGPL